MKYDLKTVGLFGTCGNSKWREPFIRKFDEIGVSWYNPCRDDWDPTEDSWQLKHNRIILMPVTNETYGTGTLSESAFGIMTIDTIREKFNICLDKVSAKKVNEEIHTVLDSLKRISADTNAKLSSADEIKKYKELLDLGAITQEEFEHKKKELLNL